MAEDCIINKLSWNISHYPNAASYIQPAFDDGDENDVHFVALPDEDWETIVFQEETVIKLPISADEDSEHTKDLHLIPDTHDGVSLCHLLTEIYNFYNSAALSEEDVAELPEDGWDRKKFAMTKFKRKEKVFWIDLVGDLLYFDGIKDGRLILER